MRDLTLDECEFVAGGDEGDIIVTGERLPPPPPPYYPPPPTYSYPPSYYGGYGGGGGYSPPPPPPDSASHDVQVNFTRPLTADEQDALNDLRASIAQADAEIQAIPDNAVLTLSNGQTVTGAELKAAWANTDFVINEVGTVYANGGTNGEANYNGGNPVVSYNINTVDGYNNFAGGTNYLVLHEIAHLVPAQRTNNANNYSSTSDGGTTYTEAERAAHERMANDIAHAVASYTGNTILANPGDGYSSTNPTFQTPTPPPPPPPSGGGGGGGGYYDQQSF